MVLSDIMLHFLVYCCPPVPLSVSYKMATLSPRIYCILSVYNIRYRMPVIDMVKLLILGMGIYSILGMGIYSILGMGINSISY